MPIPFYGELGSVNPAVVLPGAAAGRTAETATGYAASLTLGAGQFCTNPGLLFVPDDEGLRTAIAGAVQATTGAPMLSERIHESYDAAAAALAGHPAVTPLATGQPGEGPWAATPQAFLTSLDDFAAGLPDLAEERFGPAGLVITYPSVDALLPVLGRLGGNLAGSIHADPASADDLAAAAPVADVFTRTVGRVIWNGWPTGVAVTWAQHHGGPFPATTSPHYTSVGATAIRRWLVPVTYQDFPVELLPGALQAAAIVRTGAYLYPWDVDGDPAAADRLAGLGLAGVTLAAAYHAVRAVTPRHPGHRIVTRDAGDLLPARSGPLAWTPGSAR